MTTTYRATTDADPRAERLADEQAALRRVATLVAKDVAPSELFAAVAREAGALLGADLSGVARFEDRDVVTVGVWAAAGEHPPVPERWPMQEGCPATTVAEVRCAVRWKDWSDVPGPLAAYIRDEVGVRSTVGCPILVEGRLWGAIALHWLGTEPPPPETESRLDQFAELVAIAIANAEAHAQVERLAEEQATLRRVATLVARGVQTVELFTAVTQEVACLFADVEPLLVPSIIRFDPGPEFVLAGMAKTCPGFPLGTRWGPRELYASTRVQRTGRSARVDKAELVAVGGPDAELLLREGLLYQVGSPVTVEGRLWGALVMHSANRLPADTAERLESFTELVATAIANADSSDRLTASRARLLTAADDARRRLTRDLHDGAQQRVLHTVITLKLAQRALREGCDEVEPILAEALEQAEQVNEELRELSHGILPAVLTRGGLQAGIWSVVTRIDLPVDVEVTGERFPAEIEAGAYFVVAEALTNVVKHAQATRARVTASNEDDMLRVEVRDDGVGGADAGHGLVGMDDRVAALGGGLEIESPPGGGTRLIATLPLPADR